MRRIALQALTWGTVAAAVASALWLAAVDVDQGAMFRLATMSAAGSPVAWPSKPAPTGAAARRRADDPSTVRQRPSR